MARHHLNRKGQAFDREKQEPDRRANKTPRYTDAIKQLGHGSPAIRLGGIHALERIAQDSERDRQTILDVLWAYLRSESPLKNRSGAAAGAMKSDAVAAAVAAGRITHLSRPTKLTILPGVNLTGAILDSADLTDACFDGANLDGASFIEANLNYASLTDANLTGADLIGANLVNADLTGAGLTGAVLTGVRLTRANLTGTYILRITGNKLIEVPVTRKYLKDKGAKGIQTVKGLPGE